MQRNCHHARGRLRFLIQHVEGLADAPVKIVDADRGHIEQRHVIELDGIGNAVEPVVHAIRQVVIHPIADVLDVVLAQQIERVPGLGETGAEPATHRLAVAGDDRAGLGNDGCLLCLAHAREQHGVGQPVTHEFPAQPHAFVHDARIETADLAIERDRAAHAMPAQHIHDAPDADAIAVVAAGVVANIRCSGAKLDMKVLDIRNDPDRDPCAARPCKRWMIDDGPIGKMRERRAQDAILLRFPRSCRASAEGSPRSSGR
jgi:hypothetical protein